MLSELKNANCAPLARYGEGNALHKSWSAKSLTSKVFGTLLGDPDLQRRLTCFSVLDVLEPLGDEDSFPARRGGSGGKTLVRLHHITFPLYHLVPRVFYGVERRETGYQR